MAPFDTSYTTSCQSVTVNIALSCTMFELLQVEKYRDLETQVSGQSYPEFMYAPYITEKAQWCVTVAKCQGD